MSNTATDVLKSFFLRGESNRYIGIKSIRYRLMYILEPVFYLLFCIFSIIVQRQSLANNTYSFLALLYFFQCILIAFSYFVFFNDIQNRSFLLFILLTFTFFSAVEMVGFTLYLCIFLSVIVASLLYRVRRTALIFAMIVINWMYIERSSIAYLLDQPESIMKSFSTPIFVILSSWISGMTISIIVFYLEWSFYELSSLEKSLDTKNHILHKEKEHARQYRDALMGNQLKFKTIVEYAFDGITILDEKGNNKFISNSTEKITGYSPEDYTEGAINFDKVHPDDRQRVVENFRNITENRVNSSIIYYRYLHKDGDWRNLEVSVTNLLQNPGIEGILFIYRDVTKHIQAEQRARYFEYHDQLTGLPNQLMFSEKIIEEIHRSEARQRPFAIMCLGINSFKDINGQFGTAFGDLVLKHIGSRLKSNFRGDDFVSRMMGDKFLILFSDMKSENDVIAIVQKTMNSFEVPFWIDNREVQISASVGISIFPHDGTEKEELIKNSESALFQCKEDRERTYTLFNKIQNDDLIKRIQIEKEIFHAIEKKAFTVYFQPKVNTDGRVVGAEALIRWFHGERGMVSPGQFIPISERNRSIIEIGKIVMEKTFQQIRNWDREQIEPIEISINVSPLQFSDPNFLHHIDRLQETYNINPRFIEFEVTETGIMENEKKSLSIMQALIERGFSISIDDFGTGYSSLNKLKDYPLSALKIDKSFIDSVPYDESSCNIVKTIIDLAHTLKYKVIAEGVEHEGQFDFLSSYGCDLIQGYFFHKPMPSTQFEKLIKKPAL